MQHKWAKETMCLLCFAGGCRVKYLWKIVYEDRFVELPIWRMDREFLLARTTESAVMQRRPESWQLREHMFSRLLTNVAAFPSLLTIDTLQNLLTR
jgi:hypothetical protein